jgi:hypothetical protein
MTVVSVAQACGCLGIDAKTLHRWLADAHLPLRRHPHDGRKKGVGMADLQTLARLHQRRLAPLAPELPVSVPDEGLERSAALLALPEQLAALQTQISALQQQVTDLTRLLAQQAHQSAPEVAPVQPSKPPKRSPQPLPAAARARPAPSARATASRQPAHVIARVESGADGRYAVICPKRGLLLVDPDSPAWFAWLAQQESFRFVGQAGHFTAHHWWRVPKGAWRAHRHIRNHSYNLRLAPTQGLTIAVLEQAAAQLQAHL